MTLCLIADPNSDFEKIAQSLFPHQASQKIYLKDKNGFVIDIEERDYEQIKESFKLL